LVNIFERTLIFITRKIWRGQKLFRFCVLD